MLPFLAKRSFAVHRVAIRPVTLSSPLRHFWPPSAPNNTDSKEDSTPPYTGAPNTLARLLHHIGTNTRDNMKEMSPEAQWAKKEKNVVESFAQPHTAHTGRTTYVSKEFQQGYSRVQRTLAANAFVYELRLKERHEKKGAKRRRLASERWRRRFAHEVRKKVQLVKEIRARGA